MSNSGDGLAVAPASAPPESDLVLKMNGKPAYRERIGVTATLVRHGTTTPIAGEMVQLRLGGSRVWAKTDASGVASGTLTLAVPPRPTDYLLVASFAGSAHAGPAAASQALRVGKQATSIKVLQDLDVSTTPQPIRVAQLYATPGSTQPRPLGERRMILAVDGHAFVGWTDAEGAIWFDRKDLHGVPHGTYQGKLQFEGDARYAASEESLKVNV